MHALSSLRNRLIAVLATVVATAMGVVFLYVVPSLRDNLIAERFDQLEAVARSQQHNARLRSAIAHRNFRATVPALQRIARLANARVSVFRVDGTLITAVRVMAEPAPLKAPTRAVRAAARSHGIVRGRLGSDLVVAVGFPGGVVALSQPVADIDATSDLVERRILIATGLALLVALAVGWGAAYAVSRRLARLERAATRVALGEFGTPVGDDSPDELGRVGRAFDLMQTRLGQLDRSRKDFIANASHELRTPLFSLAGFLELMRDEDIDEDTREEFLREMRDQVSRLTKLATDLLDLSRLDAGAVGLEREPVDLTAAARGLVREFRGLAAGHGSRVVLSRPTVSIPHAVADEQRVQQIGRVLLDNAIRHNPSGTEVRVAVEPSNGSVTLRVSDNGPGIDEQTRAHLFERFYRGGDATASGSGLGLAIARELAERMDGSLTVETADGEKRFLLTLPAEVPGAG
ncbi:MAG: sensor histidine kinase [Gaiellales bacterium]